MFLQEEKIENLVKSIVFILIMMLLSSFFGSDGVFVIVLSLIYLKED